MGLESLKARLESCIELAEKARQSFLTCSMGDCEPEECEKYYAESKSFKVKIRELKRQIKNINKALDES